MSATVSRLPGTCSRTFICVAGAALPRKTYFETAVGFGKFRLELAEDVELDSERFAVVHVRLVAAGPAERFAVGDDFNAGDVDVSVAKEFGVLFAASRRRRRSPGGRA